MPSWMEVLKIMVIMMWAAACVRSALPSKWYHKPEEHVQEQHSNDPWK